LNFIITPGRALPDARAAMVERLLGEEVSAETLATLGMLLDADKLRRQAREGGDK
jgi:hypothetical protein